MSKIRVELELADGSFTTGVLRAGQTLGQFRQELARTSSSFSKLSNAGRDGINSIQRMDTGSRSLLSTMRDVSIVTGMVTMAFGALTGTSGGVLSSVISINSEMERLRYQMMGMSQAADPIQDAADSVAFLRDMARQAPFALNSLTGAFTKLRTTGTDPMNGSLQSIVDGVAALGGTDEQLHRIVLGISQVSGKGVLQMEELRQQIGESMPGALAIFARSMGLTMGELVQAVSTGRVEAGAALEAFYAEVDRMYGGEAARMMNTFSGQLSQLATNWQLLVTEQGGAERFFVEVREVMFDLNEFMQSDRIRAWSSAITDGLIGMVEAGRTAVSVIGSLRNEIFTVVQILAGAAAFSMAGRGIGLLLTNINLMRLSLAGGVRAFADMAAAISLFSTGITVAGQRTAATSLLIGTAGSTLMRVGGAAVAAAPMLGVLGVALYSLASYFGIFSDSSREAYEDLKRFGAQSREEAQRIVQMRADGIRSQIERLQGERNAFLRDTLIPGGPVSPANQLEADRIQEEINQLNAQLEEIAVEGASLVNEAANNAAERQLGIYARQLGDRERLVQSDYRRQVTERDQQYQSDLNAAEENGQSILEIREKYQGDLMDMQRAMAEARMRLYDEDIAAAEEAALTAQADEKDILDRRLDLLRTRRAEAMREWEQVNQRVFGVSFINAPADNTERVERGQQALQGLTEDIEGLESALDGGSSAWGEMVSRINRGFYGSSIEDATDATRQLHRALLDATMQKEVLDGLMEGRNALNSDLDNLENDLADREEELAARRLGRELTEAERIQLRMNRGYYVGIGNADQVRAAIDRIVQSMNIQGQITSEVGRAMRDDAFGNATLQSIADVRSALQGIMTDLNGIGTATGTLGFDAMTGRLAERVGLLPGMNGNATIPQGAPAGAYVPLPADTDYVRYTNQGTTRDQALSTRLTEAMSFLREMGIVMQVFSGGQDGIGTPGARRTGSTRHDHGDAADVMFYQNGRRLDFNQNPGDIPIYQEIVRRAMGAGLTGFGAANGYMSSGSMHIGYGAPAIWGGSGANAGRPVAAWLAEAFAQGPLGGPVRTSTSTGEALAQSVQTLSQSVQTLATAPVDDQPRPFDTAYFESLIAQQVEVTQQAEERRAALGERERAVIAGEQDQALADMLRELGETGAQLAETLGREVGSNEQRIIDAIRSGDLGSSRDPNDERYAAVLSRSREVDTQVEFNNEQRRLRNELDRENERLLEQSVDLAVELENQRRRADDPDWLPEPEQIARLNRELDTYVQNVARIHGGDSQQYTAAVQLRSQMLSNSRRSEALSRLADMRQETRDAERQGMTRTQQRQREYQDAMSAVDRWVEYARQSGLSETEILMQAEQQRAAIRQRFAAQSPMQQQMREWSDLMGNLEQNNVRAMDSLANGITDLIMGTGDLQSVLQGILREYVNTIVRYMMSAGKGQGGGGKAGLFNKQSVVNPAAQTGKSGLGKMVGMKHTGGIIGRAGGSRTVVDPSVFLGAPKFHTGGIVGGNLGKRMLRSDEVPIIAKKDEGIFTPEQMAALGGVGNTGQNISINAPVSVSGGGGSHEQNRDLADQIGRQMERNMRSVVIDELRRQMRPGNMMR